MSRGPLRFLFLAVLGLAAAWMVGRDALTLTSADSAPAPDAASAPQDSVVAVAESAPATPTSPQEMDSLPAGPASEASRDIPQARRMTPAQARAAMLQWAQERDCITARRAARGDGDVNYEPVFWRWMQPEQVAIERLGQRAATGRLMQGCPPEQAADNANAESRRRLAAAVAAGDVEARLLAWRDQRQLELARGQAVSPERLAELRQLLQEALLSGDLDLLGVIARNERELHLAQAPRDLATWQSETAWQLVACDLGYDCGPTSRLLDRMCLRQTRGACGAANYEEALRFTLHPGIFERLQQRRAALLARIRAGQIAGIFDPPPETPTGGRGP